jgi:hypothetical protein
MQGVNIQPSPGGQNSSVVDTQSTFGGPPRPVSLDPGSGSRADRLRMLQQMRHFGDAEASAWRSAVRTEVADARRRQANVNSFWTGLKETVQKEWTDRPHGRGMATVADFPQLASQWHPSNDGSPAAVIASEQGAPGDKSPYRWSCPMGLSHAPWSAWPKDRVQKGSGCPSCRKLIKLTDIPSLAAQYNGCQDIHDISFGSCEELSWIHRTWAVNPETGFWRRAEHHFNAVVKSRSQQGHGCLVCAGFVIDDTNSLATWFPELAAELDDPSLDPSLLPTSTHNLRKTRNAEHADERYATVPWRCRHGHQWKTTILSRVQGNNCNDCSTSGISKEQVRLVAELTGLMELAGVGRKDPRLPDGVPNFASHKLQIPAHLKPAHWRYRAVEVDAVFMLPDRGVTLGLEYDGAYSHSQKRRDRLAWDVEKGQVLTSIGMLDLMVHVRIGGLPPLSAPHALAVEIAEQGSAFEQAAAAGRAIESRFPGSLPRLNDYITGGRTGQDDVADAYINAVWGTPLVRSRRKPEGELRKRPNRKLQAKAPPTDSLLVPVGGPYRSPGNQRKILRDYECQGEGNRITREQSQVTRGDIRSCGCLEMQAKSQPRRSVPRAETRQARRWAQQTGIPLKSNGRVPDQVIASFRLHQAGQLHLLGPAGVLDEDRVRDWANKMGLRLGARNRLPSRAWLDFTDQHLVSLTS